MPCDGKKHTPSESNNGYTKSKYLTQPPVLIKSRQAHLFHGLQMREVMFSHCYNSLGCTWDGMIVLHKDLRTRKRS